MTDARLFLLAGLSFVLSSNAAAQAPSPADLAGDWRLDPSLSDDVADILRRRGGGGAYPGGRARGGRGGPGAMGLADPRQMAAALRAPQQLAITAKDDALGFRADLGFERIYYLDGRETVDTLGDLTVRKSRARWKKDRLAIERRIGQHGSAQETLRIEPESGLLVSELKIDGPGKLTLRRVYRRLTP